MYVLITKGTKDEAYYWLSKRRAGDAKKIRKFTRCNQEEGSP